MSAASLNDHHLSIPGPSVVRQGAERQTSQHGPLEQLSTRRVLLLVESSAPSRYWEAAIPLLQAAGTEVLLATVRERGPLHESVQAMGCRTFALGCRTSWDYPRAALALATFIRQHKIDLIHAGEPIPGSIGGCAGLLARRAKRIFHRHHTFANGKQKLLSRVSSRLAHLTMACSETVARSANRFDGVPPSQVCVAYNGVKELRQVQTKEVAALRLQLGIPNEARVISIVARLRSQKGHSTLFAALRLMASEFAQPPHLAIVGSGQEEAALREQARALSHGTVHFVGHQEDIAPWFALGDVIAMPSYYEPFGLSAVEAMACSRPLVASRVDGLAEIVEDGVTGLLVPPNDSQALANALISLLRSPATATRLGTAAYESFRTRFTIEAMVKSWLGCYAEVLSISGKS